MLIEDNKEVEHIISVLKQTQKALVSENSYLLNELSDQTIHSASITQHTDYITIAVVLYSLNKILARRDHWHIKSWPNFVKKFNDELNKTISSIRSKDQEEIARHLGHAKQLIENLSPNLRPDVEGVIKKAEINKAGKIYEHGISLQQTAHLLNLSQWEILDYIGQRSIVENPLNQTIEVKKRIKQAQDFLEK